VQWFSNQALHDCNIITKEQQLVAPIVWIWWTYPDSQ